MDFRSLVLGMSVVLSWSSLDAQTLSPAQQEAFALVDRFDDLDTATLPFVRVAIGNWVKPGNAAATSVYRWGFLLAREGSRFTVRYLDLVRDTLTETPAGTPEPEEVGFEVTDLASYAREAAEHCASGATPPACFPDLETTMEVQALALLAARACARRALSEEVSRLWASIDEAKALEQLGEGLRSQLPLHFLDPELRWADLLRRHRFWLEHFPGARGRDVVARRAAILARMVDEDRERARRGTASDGGSIADLVHRLREERFPVGKGRPYGSYVAGDGAPDEDRPVEQILRLGFVAVPELIEALGDDTLTRCVWSSVGNAATFWDGTFSFGILSVGELARQLLVEIAGVDPEGAERESKEAWRRWWRSVSSDGEEATLANMARHGTRASVDASRRLLDRWPGRLDDVIAGIRAADSRCFRCEMIELLEHQHADRVTTFLLEEVENGPYVSCRATAARILIDRGRTEGLRRFITEWPTADDPREGAQADESGPGHLLRAHHEAREAMASFLLHSGDPEAVATVLEGLSDRSEALRSAVALSLLRTHRQSLLERAAPRDCARIENTIEDVLASLLEEGTRPHQEDDAPLGSRSSAALALAELWPDRYRLDPNDSRDRPGRRFRELLNIWRQRRGQPPLPTPPIPDLRSPDGDR